LPREWLAVGTVADRHRLNYPVEHFLILSVELVPFCAQLNYDNTYTRALKLPFDERRYAGIQLYYSGYTPAYQAAMDAFAARNIDCVPMPWNKKTNTYAPLRRRHDTPENAL
jgi:hypothetical protein